ncbi:Nitrilase [Candidatus Desulfarcum epimagneticum]|uniref:Nitrilase n=1 Tax=uncultured Desulfobacteraceae bacterium TaxID=218296 RepID=A0A484HGT6_9BACT|nr:Nitrilase [uncultured Desulfobacteraceae bacterium]
MRIAVFQTSPAFLDIPANLEAIIEKIRYGAEKGTHLNVFPELALTGYFVGEKYPDAALMLTSSEIKRLAKATKNTAAVVGFIEESPSMNFYNAALVAIDGEIRFAYRKLNLPNYGVFEEGKYFSTGKQVKVFRHRGLNIALFICNDTWHPSLPYLAVCQKADIFISMTNSSKEAMGSEFSNIENWHIINTFYSRVFGIYNVFVNRCGKESVQKTDQQTQTYQFWGGSEIVNPFGKTVYKAAYDAPDTIIGEIDKTVLRQKKIVLPYLKNDNPYFTYRELKRILHKR